MKEIDIETNIEYGLSLIDSHKNIYIDWERCSGKSTLCREYIFNCITDKNNTKKIVFIPYHTDTIRNFKSEILKYSNNNDIKCEYTKNTILVNGTKLFFTSIKNNLESYFRMYSDAIYVFDELTITSALTIKPILENLLNLNYNLYNACKFIFITSPSVGDPFSQIASIFYKCCIPLYHSKAENIKTEFRRMKIKKLMGNIS